MRRDEYCERGFGVRRGLLPPDLVEALNQRFADVADGKVEPARNVQVVRNVQVAKGLVTPGSPAAGISKVNFIQNDPVFCRFSQCGPLLDQVEELIGPGLNKTQGLRRAMAVHFASSHCDDIWQGKTEFSNDKVDPRLDMRLVRGEDPHGYAAAR